MYDMYYSYEDESGDLTVRGYPNGKLVLSSDTVQLDVAAVVELHKELGQWLADPPREVEIPLREVPPKGEFVWLGKKWVLESADYREPCWSRPACSLEEENLKSRNITLIHQDEVVRVML